MTQVFFVDMFYERNLHLNALETRKCFIRQANIDMCSTVSFRYFKQSSILFMLNTAKCFDIYDNLFD